MLWCYGVEANGIAVPPSIYHLPFTIYGIQREALNA